MKSDLDRLQGSWRVTSLILEGSAWSARMIGDARVEIEGGRFRSLGLGLTFEGLLRLESRRRPKAFSIKFTRGPEKGNVIHGIYELNANRWRLCFAAKGGPAPHAFVSTPGSGFAMEILDRDVNPPAPLT